MGQVISDVAGVMLGGMLEVCIHLANSFLTKSMIRSMDGIGWVVHIVLPILAKPPQVGGVLWYSKALNIVYEPESTSSTCLSQGWEIQTTQ